MKNNLSVILSRLLAEGVLLKMHLYSKLSLKKIIVCTEEGNKHLASCKPKLRPCSQRSTIARKNSQASHPAKPKPLNPATTQAIHPTNSRSHPQPPSPKVEVTIGEPPKPRAYREELSLLSTNWSNCSRHSITSNARANSYLRGSCSVSLKVAPWRTNDFQKWTLSARLHRRLKEFTQPSTDAPKQSLCYPRPEMMLMNLWWSSLMKVRKLVPYRSQVAQLQPTQFTNRQEAHSLHMRKQNSSKATDASNLETCRRMSSKTNLLIWCSARLRSRVICAPP